MTGVQTCALPISPPTPPTCWQGHHEAHGPLTMEAASCGLCHTLGLWQGRPWKTELRGLRLFCPAQITRKFRLNSDGKLEQTVSMATTTQPMTQHLHVTYKKVTP